MERSGFQELAKTELSENQKWAGVQEFLPFFFSVDSLSLDLLNSPLKV